MLETQLQILLAEGDPLTSWRKKYWDHFRKIGSFEEKKEALRYLPLKNLVFPKPAVKKGLPKNSKAKDQYQIVLIDGFFSKELSQLPEGVVCIPMDEAIRSYGVFLQNRITRTLKEEIDPFAALSGVFQGLGAFLYIPSKTQLDAPVFLHHYSVTGDMATPNVTLYVGSDSSLSIKQVFHYERAMIPFINSHLDLVLEQRANVTLKMEQKKMEGHFFQAVRVSLKKNSKLIARLYSEGAKLARNSFKIQLLEEGADALLQGVTLGTEKMASHIHTIMEHLAPHAKSYQHFKALMRDESLSSFEGKIHVHSIAQKTDSYQLSNNLLLSPTAKAYVKPNLEVSADDVKASHGATLSQLDEESLFYMQSRGIGLGKAKQLLTDSFLQELKECLP